MVTSNLEEQIRRLPESPGVYLMKDAEGTILYVGKAARLRHRVRSYFTRRHKLTPKLKRLVAGTADIDFFITASEQEALILELNLIKRHRPHFNVQLKDDKSFPYLKINLGQEWPRIIITRRLEEGGARYFGPFASAKSVRQTLRVIKEIFPFRTCSEKISGHRPRPCLEYDIHQCLAPCIDTTIKEEYAEVIRRVILFLEGRQQRVIKELERKMQRAAEGLYFEKAAIIREQIQAVERVIEGQKIATRVRGEQDVIAFVQEKDQAHVQVFFVRGGRLIGRDSFTLKGTGSETPSRIMTSFLEQFYSSASHIPPLILLQHPVEDKAIIENWLSQRRGGRVRLQVPQRGSKKELVNIVASNARQGLEQLKIKQLPAPAMLKNALAEIKRGLDLPRLPARMEGYDISNIRGTDAVGSMVVFAGGKPSPAHYRRFRIKTVAAADDCAMLKEVIRRRFGRYKSGAPGQDSWAVLPDLVLIDGGRGQLNAALEVMREAGVEAVPVASLAKENEEIFRPRQPQAITLPATSAGLKLLQHLRDEAHRFALGYHHKLRRRQATASALDDIPGIGPKRKRSLLRQFGSVTAIREAPLKELAAARGMNTKLAARIKEYL